MKIVGICRLSKNGEKHVMSAGWNHRGIVGNWVKLRSLVFTFTESRYITTCGSLSGAPLSYQETAAEPWPAATRPSWRPRRWRRPRAEAPPLAPSCTRRRTGTGYTASSESWPSCWTSRRSGGTTAPATSCSCSPEKEERRGVHQTENRKPQRNRGDCG